MKKYILTAIAALFSVISIQAAEKTYTVNVGRFDKIQITDNVNVVYRSTPDSLGRAVYTCSEDLADAFIFSNNKGKLHVQVATLDVDASKLPTLYLYSDFLVSVDNSSDANTTVALDTPVPSFSAKQVGNGSLVVKGIDAEYLEGNLSTGKGKVVLSGNADKAVYKMLGTGSVQADNVDAEDVKCSILGTGNIYCDAGRNLEVKGIGSTKIYYKGEPTIKKKGGGSLIPLMTYLNE